MGSKKTEIEKIVDKLNLKPLWNGDFLTKFYESDIKIPESALGEYFEDDRGLYSQAYYLLPEGVISPLHRMYADESWQYCLGGPLELFVISAEGSLEHIVIGDDILSGQKLVHIVPAGHWFAARTQKGAGYTLVSHLVSPSFMDQDWEKGYYSKLEEIFFQHDEFLKEFSWPCD